MKKISPSVKPQITQIAQISVPDEQIDREMGAQLTGQAQKVAALPLHEIVIFAAMWEKVESRVSMSARGHADTNDLRTDKAARFSAKGKGMKAWLAEYAPAVDRQTGYRWHDVGLSIWRGFAAERLPETLARKVDFQTLATSTPKELKAVDPRLVKKQLELWEFASTGSQRSWLDRYKEDRGGGHNYDHKVKGKGHTKLPWEDLPHDQQIELIRGQVRDEVGQHSHYYDGGRWKYLLSHEINKVADFYASMAKEMREFAKLSQEERERLALERARA